MWPRPMPRLDLMRVIAGWRCSAPVRVASVASVAPVAPVVTTEEGTEVTWSERARHVASVLVAGGRPALLVCGRGPTS